MTIRTVRNLRRLSQIVFFAVFVWLILKTTFEVDFSPENVSDIRLPYPVSIALEFDPLVALATLLANGTVYHGLLWSLVILVPTIFIGRFFCGWVCPMGTINHWVSELPSERKRRKGAARIAGNRYMGYQRIKYYLLFVLLAASLTGVMLVGLFDPLTLLARSLGTVVLPIMHTAAAGLTGWAQQSGVPLLGSLAERAYDIAAGFILPYRQAYFNTIITLGIFFIAVLVLNRVYTRFWCRGICPLGALLGVFSRFAIFGLEKRESECDHCNICSLHCQGGDNPDPRLPWHATECHLCLNCQAECPRGSLRFKFFPNLSGTESIPAAKQSVDVTRRKVTAAVVGGLAMYPLLRTTEAYATNNNPTFIRPPGSAPEQEFLARCIRCGQCMRVCPNNALHPTLLEAGLEGLWSPILIAKIGYCEPTCTLCGQVCPTGAIAELTTAEKVGNDGTPPNRIGTAFVDRGRCLPFAMGTSCIVCEEWCPTVPKAIYLEDHTVTRRDGTKVTVKRPWVDPAVCTGCGACEYACPVADESAIRVTAVGESRSSKNQMILERPR